MHTMPKATINSTHWNCQTCKKDTVLAIDAHSLRTYLLYVVLCIVIVQLLATIQHIVILGYALNEIRPHMLIIPSIAGSLFGVMIATIQMLRKRERKHLHAMQLHEAKLEEEVGIRRQMEQNLKLKSQDLESANRELESFGYSVSHDLRAPLRRINGFSEALAQENAEKLDAVSKDYLARIRSGCVVMSEMIEGLQTLSLVTRAEMRHAEVDLSDIAHQVIEDLRSGDERPVEVTIQPGLHAQGDPNLLRLALENLLGNAWKFTRKTPQPRIEFGTVKKEGEPVYFVRDNGAGFDANYAERLFGAFQRLHDSNEFEGTGVGLATVQRVVRRHGGNIRGEGEMGKGATFYFTL